VDRTDLNIILSHRNQPADVCPECDLDGDGMITALDAKKLVQLFTLPRCVSVGARHVSYGDNRCAKIWSEFFTRGFGPNSTHGNRHSNSKQ